VIALRLSGYQQTRQVSHKLFSPLFSHIRDEIKKHSAIPETRVGEEGTAKRNIQRKNDHDPNRKTKPHHGGALGGKGQWNDMDDGSLP
jgi:hypothetical protein